MTRIRSIAALAFAAVMIAGCSANSESEGSTPSASTAAATGSTPSSSATETPGADETFATQAPSTTAADDGVTNAIVSISPTATEMLFAIGAGDRVIAVDSQSNYPEEAVAKQTDIEAFTPNVEAIAALNPDLVVSDGSNPEFLAQLDSLQLKHWEGPAATSLDDVYTQIEQLGAVTDHVGDAAELVSSIQTNIAAIVEGAPDADAVSFYHELDNTYYSATSATFIGQIYGLFSMTNIADGGPDGPAAQYPQLSAEYIISANPNIIYLGCGAFCGDTAETVGARPGWDQITAVRDGHVVELDADVVSRWGPRVVEFAQAIADSLANVNAGANG